MTSILGGDSGQSGTLNLNLDLNGILNCVTGNLLENVKDGLQKILDLLKCKHIKQGSKLGTK